MRIRRLLRSPLFWIALAAVQVVHPLEPATHALWTRVGTRTDVVLPPSVRARRTPDGGLEVEYAVERTERWLRASESRATLTYTASEAELLARPNRFRSSDPPDPVELGDSVPPGALRVLSADGWLLPGFECVVAGPETYWTTGKLADGDAWSGQRMTLPLGGTSDLGGATLVRVLATVPALAFDVLGAPRMLAEAAYRMVAFSGVSVH